MTWLDHHRLSEVAAMEAAEAKRAGDLAIAVARYRDAASHEQQALNLVDGAKTRTFAIIAVSVAALWFKAEEFALAERAALSALNHPNLPAFSKDELRLIIQHVWTAMAKQQAGVRFVPGQVVVSVKGGAVVTGGAPLDLIVEKVQLVQAMFYRTIEHLSGLPLRKAGPPRKEVSEACQPWLFQEAPGSYQFSVAIQEPEQRDWIRSEIPPSRIASHFLDILRAAVTDPDDALPKIVPQREYRTTFLKLSRGLSPTPKSSKYARLDVSLSGEPVAVSFNEEHRSNLNRAIRREEADEGSKSGQRVEIRGTLRAVHLDKDWIDVFSEGKSIHIVGVNDTVDDLIGPLVNRTVIVQALRQKRRTVFVDIEADD